MSKTLGLIGGVTILVLLLWFWWANSTSYEKDEAVEVLLATISMGIFIAAILAILWGMS